MIRDTSIPNPETGTGERRRDEREAASGELCLTWMHDPGTVVRLALLDRSDHGFRVRSSLPVLNGTVGRVLRVLPAGEPVDRSYQVAWIRSRNGAWELGLEQLEAA